MWTVEYQETRGGPWIFAGVWAPTADRAWEAFSLIVAACGVRYYAAQAFGAPASLAALRAAGHRV